jgi:hypothetical protein
LAFIVQSSRRENDEDGFQVERNFISELTGRFNLGVNKVHVAHMYYGKTTRRLSTLQKISQQRPSVTIERAESIPYIPYDMAPIADALRLAQNSIFNVKRDAMTSTVPRVVILFNENPSNDTNTSSLLLQANSLKLDTNPIEIFTIGIGSKYNKSELNSIASQSDYYVHVDDFESLFQVTNDLAQLVCSVQAEIEFDVKVNVTCLKGEMRYFKASTKKLTKTFVAYYTNEYKGYARFYFSFKYKNPNSVYNDAKILNQMKFSSLPSIESSSGIFYMEKNPEEYVYVSMQCVDMENEIQLILKNEDL